MKILLALFALMSPLSAQAANDGLLRWHHQFFDFQVKQTRLHQRHEVNSLIRDFVKVGQRGLKFIHR